MVPSSSSTVPTLPPLDPSYSPPSPPTVRMIFPTTVPSQLFGRATLWLPDPLRKARNAAILLTIIEMSISIVSLPIGFSRISLGKIADGIEVVLFFTALVGFLGSSRIKISLILLHAIMATGVSGVFLLYLILLILFSSTTEDENRKEDPRIFSAVLSTVFISNISDFVAGLMMTYFYVRLHYYEEAMKKEDTVAQQRFERLMYEQQLQQPEPHVSDEGSVPYPHQDDLPDERSSNDPTDNVGKNNNTTSSRSSISPSAPVLDTYIPSSNVWLESTATTNTSTTSVGLPSGTNSNDNRSNSRSLPHTVTVPPISPSASAASTITTVTSSVSSVPNPNILLCPICMDRPKTTVYYDCGHMACDICADVMYRQYQKCPLCRKLIKGTVKLYA